MKSLQTRMIVFGFILLALMTTNPSLEDHRQAVFEVFDKKFKESDELKNDNSGLGEILQTIGNSLSKGIIEKAITRNNYILFSFTNITFLGSKKVIGIGIAGNVWIDLDLTQNNWNTSEDQLQGNINMPLTKIGNQMWMSSNLNVDHFRNGDIIPEAKTKEEWYEGGRLGKPTWCYYLNKSTNGFKYGKLYNWFAVSDIRGLAPNGFHIATHKDIGNWERSKSDGNIEYGGCRHSTGDFSNSDYAYFWTADGDGLGSVWLFQRGYSGDKVDVDVDQRSGFYVKCVKD